MNKQRITTKQLALCSVLLTLMLVLGWVESLFPPLLGVPGIKLGLSNGVLISRSTCCPCRRRGC